MRNKARCVTNVRTGTTMTFSMPIDARFQGRPVFVGVYEDITERKRAAEALRETQMQLAHANRVAMMEQLKSSIAHEVTQPITAAATNAHAALHFLYHAAPDHDEV